MVVGVDEKLELLGIVELVAAASVVVVVVEGVVESLAAGCLIAGTENVSNSPRMVLYSS